jgi:superfamily II DNA or RNA helicase
VLLVAPTGSGKTVIASHIIHEAVRKGNRVLFLAHRRELVTQCCEKLRVNDVQHGIIMRGHPRAMLSTVQVASKDTLYARAIKRDRMELPEAELLVFDEAHRSLAKTWTEVAAAYPNAVLLGLTATPARSDGRGLGENFERMVVAAQYRELIQEGSLVPTRVFAPDLPDLTGVKIQGGDYARGQLEERMNKKNLVGSIMEHWRRLAHERQTIVFASGVGHSTTICETLQRAGINAEHVDGSMDTSERDWLIGKFKRGEIQVMCNCMVLTEGFDYPECSCAVLACPTRSIVKYRQMAGRIQRPADGKEDAIIIDHAGCVHEMGFPDEDVPWRLEPSHNVNKAKRKERESKPIICQKCYCEYEGQRFCPACGEPAPKRRPQVPTVVRGTLQELARYKALANSTVAQRQRFFDQCLQLCVGKDMKLGAAARMYEKRFGILPWKHRGDNKLKLPKPAEWKLRGREYYRQMKEKENGEDLLGVRLE